jgi:hypothetical protein
VTSVLLAGCVACNKISYNFSKISTDSNMHVSTSGMMFSEPAEGEYYYFAHDPAKPTIDHFYKKHGETTPLRELFLEMDPKQNLIRTVKHDVIMFDPAYGYVYADKLCFYQTGGTVYPNSVEVGSFFNSLEEDLPVTLKSAPSPLPPLTSISYIRMFHPDPDYFIVSANYEANGDLSTLHVDHTKGGVWVSGTDDVIPKDTSEEGMKAANLKPDLLTKYGIPAHIDVASYLAANKMDVLPTTLPAGRIVLNLHYGWNKVIRQDELNAGRNFGTIYLQPTLTEEEKTLNPVCDAKLQQQQAAGEATAR